MILGRSRVTGEMRPMRWQKRQPWDRSARDATMPGMVLRTDLDGVSRVGMERSKPCV